MGSEDLIKDAIVIAVAVIAIGWLLSFLFRRLTPEIMEAFEVSPMGKSPYAPTKSGGWKGENYGNQ